jgi:hypothetical protein
LSHKKQIEDLGVKIISIADTVGLATASQVEVLMKSSACFKKYSCSFTFIPENRIEKLVEASFKTQVVEDLILP